MSAKLQADRSGVCPEQTRRLTCTCQVYGSVSTEEAGRLPEVASARIVSEPPPMSRPCIAERSICIWYTWMQDSTPVK
eukprot:664129-Amphidinium_carterae.1